MPSWRSEGCGCVASNTGVPNTQHMANLQYMGRIRLPELEFLGGEVELDHWANWFFHIFMNTNTSAPDYGRGPIRVSDSLAGPANTGLIVYANWTLEDPAIEDPTIWYRGLPDGDAVCANLGASNICDNISQSTFPPADISTTLI